MREKRSDARVISATMRVISSLGNNKKSRERAHDTLRMPCDKSANRLCELRRDCHIYTQAYGRTKLITHVDTFRFALIRRGFN